MCASCRERLLDYQDNNTATTKSASSRLLRKPKNLARTDHCIKELRQSEQALHFVVATSHLVDEDMRALDMMNDAGNRLARLKHHRYHICLRVWSNFQRSHLAWLSRMERIVGAVTSLAVISALSLLHNQTESEIIENTCLNLRGASFGIAGQQEVLGHKTTKRQSEIVITQLESRRFLQPMNA